MFSRAAKRRIAEQDAVIGRLRADLKKTRDERDTAAAKAKAQDDRVERFAGDRIKAATGDAREMARLQEVAEAWAALARADQTRADRILQSAIRFRDRINTLQEQIAKYEGGDRAVMNAPRTGADAVAQLIEARAVIARQREQIHKQEDQLAILQKANEAKYWRLARRAAAAVPEAPVPLQAAS